MRALAPIALLLLAACSAPSPKEVAATSSFALAREHGRFLAIGGIETFAITIGEGPDIVLLHGSPLSTYSWRHVIPRLAERYRVHAIDLPGYGFSGKPPDAPYTDTWMAGQVAAFMDAAGIESAVLIGSSTGGEIASEVASIYPRRVRAMVLIAPSGVPTDDLEEPPLAIRLARVPLLGTLAAQLPVRPFVGATLRDAYFDPALVTEADIDAHALPLRSRDGLTAFLASTSRVETSDRSMLVRGIKVPTLVLLGEVDRFVPLSVGRKYHELIAGSDLVVIERSGHLPQEERPEATLVAIEAFLAHLPVQ